MAIYSLFKKKEKKNNSPSRIENINLLNGIKEWMKNIDTEEYWKNRTPEIIDMQLNNESTLKFCDIDNDTKFEVFDKFFKTLTTFPFMEKRHEANELYIKAAEQFGFKKLIMHNFFDIFKTAKYHMVNKTPSPANKDDKTEKKKLGPMDVTYHTSNEIPSWVNDVNIENKDLTGSSNVIIDNIEVSPSLKRSKELLDKLNMKDKHGDFKTECIKFQNELRSESEKIASMTESFIERVNKYMNDTNVL